MSLRLHLLLNKCDTLEALDEDEEPPDYDRLVAEVAKEAKNYCQPNAHRLSIRDWKKKGETAVQEWKDMFAAVQSAILARKKLQWERCLLDANRVITGLETALDHGQKFAKLSAEVQEKKERLEDIKKTEEEYISKRTEEIKSSLEANRDAHLEALCKREVSYENKSVTKEQEKEVDEEIINIVGVMIQNDIQVSMEESVAMGAVVASAGSIFAAAFAVAPVALIADFVISAMVGEAILLFTSVLGLAVGACGLLVLAAPFAAVYYFRTTVVIVDASYKKKRFDKLYTATMENASKYAEREFAALVDTMEKQIQSDEKMLADLKQKKRTLDEGVCKKILDDLRMALKES